MIRRTSTGNWQARFSWQSDGRQKQTARNFRTRAEAQTWEREQETLHALGQYAEPSRMTLDAWLDQWLAGRTGIEGRTRADLEDVLRRYWRAPLGGIKLAKLTTAMIRRELRALEAAGKSPRTIQMAHSVLRQALNAAVADNRLNRNPAVADGMVPKQVRAHRSPWDAAEMRTFLTTRADDPLVAFWAVSLYAGLRPSETIALTWGDVDLSESEPHVSVHRSFERARRGFPGGFKSTKTNRERVVPLLPPVVRLLRERRAVAQLMAGDREIATDLVFAGERGQPLREDRVSKQFQAAIEAAKVRRQRLYDRRHAAATLWIEAGEELAVVSRMLGHASINLTANTYGHIRPKALHRSAVRVAAFLSETEAAA